MELKVSTRGSTELDINDLSIVSESLKKAIRSISHIFALSTAPTQITAFSTFVALIVRGCACK